MTETAASEAARAEDLAAKRAFVAAFAEGWRAPADADAFSDFFDEWFTDDVRLIQPQVPTAVGREAFRERFARPIFALIPDLHAVVQRWAPTEDGVLIEFTLTGTLGGRAVSWHAVDRISIRDGRAYERRAYFDPLVLLGAVVRTPRAWPRFAQLQLTSLRNRLRKG
jgi:ketosteroid isomerase-like protein